MIRVILPSPWDLEYCSSYKDTIKELGGEWDSKDMLWLIPTTASLPLELKSYVLK